ncbi:hypothetical protein B296_00040017, partial [Ensete ventricosum]
GIASSCVGTRRHLALFISRGEGGVASSRVGTWRRLTSFIPRGIALRRETSDLTVPTGRSVYRYPVGPVESGDLIAYGLVPEFVGRFPVLVKLHFTDAALCLIAKKSMAKNTGARDVNTEGKDEPIDAVVVDEDAVGSVDRPGSGAKILRGDGALERYITGSKIKDHPVSEGVEVESEGESEDASRALGL